MSQHTSALSCFFIFKSKSTGVVFKSQTVVFETSFSKVYCYFTLLNTCREETISDYFSTVHSCTYNS